MNANQRIGSPPPQNAQQQARWGPRSSGRRVMGSSENPFGHNSFWIRAFKSKFTNQKSKIYCLIWIFFLIAIPAYSQAPNFRVRLYSLHTEQRIKITARTGDLSWKTCEQCPAKHAPALGLDLSAQGMTIEGEGQAQRQVLVEGDYRIEPS